MADAWRVEVRVRDDLPDPAGRAARDALRGAGLSLRGPVRALAGYLIGAEASREAVEAVARCVLADPVTDRFAVLAPDEHPSPRRGRVTVRPRAGVTDQVAASLRKALRDRGLPELPTGTYRAFLLDAERDADVSDDALRRAAQRSLANDVVQEVLLGTPPEGLPGPGRAADLAPREVPLRALDDAALERLSVDGGLALTVREMRAIQAHYRELGREPRHIELETLAQTWSEHCKHKTLTGRIRFVDHDAGGAAEIVDNLLKSEIARVTRELDRDFCVSVFEDNAGVVAFDDEDCVCIKVETHNRPSAIEPFGGAATGVGGVIRDVLGTGRGARPIASTDVFCFAPLDTPEAEVPKGCLPPERVLRGVVAGVRDYGNPMGIPTVHGAVHFDPDFIGNPLVYVGNVGILPRDKVGKQPRDGDRIVAVGGRTGRDGIHGATFSSLGLHTESEVVSSGAVQIGDPITERKVMDLVLRARDEELFTAITDCGAGGFSSAVGEMGEHLGADVDLATAPLKYAGLAPWEIWVSEAQERMVLAVPADRLPRLLALCDEEDVEATVLGTFTSTGRLVLRYGDVVHADLDMRFLHDGVPVFERDAEWRAPVRHDPELPPERDLANALLAVLRDPNVASKEWIVRQYDHEVQAGSAGKPFCGVAQDGPADGAVLAPKLGSLRGVVLSSGLNPRYSRIDPAAMAECAVDEALRNIVALGGDPDRTAILDNYSWANCSDPAQLGALVRATRALCRVAQAYGTPFVSGKDSLNNSFRDGERLIQIPGCILVTALSVIPDVTRTIGSAPRHADAELWLVGATRRELGGSVYWKTRGALGASVPRVDVDAGRDALRGVHRAIAARAIHACHDLSEGGLGAAVAEMAIAARIGVEIDLAQVPRAALADGAVPTAAEELLFSETPSRFLAEVPADRAADLRANLHGVPAARLGRFTRAHRDLVIRDGPRELARVPVDALVDAFKTPLDLDRRAAEEVR
ncbi:MAG: phosphoribosylformylglycinamidine synthase subunit PurL [Planctomycetes bacterium]|nr:phosphoribosylformylglycinamidine synthase subunit PurL [Planctomycetota bacterium]